MKKIMLLSILFIITSLIGKEYLVSPATGNLNELRTIKPINTIDGLVYYESNNNFSKKFSSNMLLLQKATDISLKNNRLTQEELELIEKSFNKVEKILNSIDLSEKITELIVGANILDAKGIVYSIWDLSLKNKVQAIFPNNPGAVDTIEQLVKLAIDTVIEKTKFETSILARATGKKFTEEVLSKVTGKLNVAFMVYSGIMNTAKLVNAYRSLKNVNDVQKKQIENIVMSSFIYDYVLKYKGDIQRMYRNYVPGHVICKTYDTKQLHNFWTVWFYYNKKENDNDEWFSKLSLSSLSTKEQYNLALETWKLLIKYDTHFFSDTPASLIEDIEKYDKRYYKIYRTQLNFYKQTSNANINRALYSMPLKIADNDYDSIKNGCLREIFYYQIYFTANTQDKLSYEKKKLDSSSKDVEVYKVKSRFKFHTLYNGVDGEYTINSNFYLPAFYPDVPDDYWAMPYIYDLFKKDIMTGYKNRNFGIKNNITNGEFLAVFVRSFYKDATKIVKNYKQLKFPLNYATYLKEKKNLDVDLSNINRPAKRGYIAKILALYLNKNLKYKELDGDWDTYSDYLNQKCILNGKKDLIYKGYMKFAPNDYITRDEFAVMISNTLKVKSGNVLTCNKRKHYPFKFNTLGANIVSLPATSEKVTSKWYKKQGEGKVFSTYLGVNAIEGKNDYINSSADEQCTGLIKRFYKTIFNMPYTSNGNGKYVAQNIVTNSKNKDLKYQGKKIKLYYQTNGLSKIAPVNGSIISLDNNGDSVGHVAIAKNVICNSTNTKCSVYLFEQNYTWYDKSSKTYKIAKNRYAVFTKDKNGYWQGSVAKHNAIGWTIAKYDEEI